MMLKANIEAWLDSIRDYDDEISKETVKVLEAILK